MLIKLCTSLISINLVVSKQLSTIIIYMHNFEFEWFSFIVL